MCLIPGLNVLVGMRIVEAATSTGSVYTPMLPRRVLDTRGSGETLDAGEALPLEVAGVGGVPANASAVVMNVTVTDTTGSGFLTVYPDGGGRPLASNLNWVAGQTRANLVVVSPGAGGEIVFYASGGSTDVIADLQGYFAPGAAGGAGGYVPLTPGRIADTRPGSESPYAGRTLGPRAALEVQVAGEGGVPATGVAAAIVNVTATNTTSSSFLSVYPASERFPGTSNLNWVAGATVANLLAVPLSPSGAITLYNHSGQANVLVDVDGYMTSGAGGPASATLFFPTPPTRVLDTRSDGGTLRSGSFLTEQFAGLSGVASGASAIVANVTATNTSASSYLSLSPGPTPPSTSALNWPAGGTVANLAVATLSADGDASLYNHAGSADAVVDVFGYFEPAGVAQGTSAAPCRDTSLSAPSPVTIGDQLNLAADTSCSAGTSEQFTFWVEAPGATDWTLAQGLSTDPTLAASTSGWAPGIYQFLVWASSAGAVYQQTLARASILVEPPPCSGVSLTASPTPGLVSDPVILAATPQCPGGEPAYLEFLYAPAGSPQAPALLSGGWTTATTFLVPTGGWASGRYSFTVVVSSVAAGSGQANAVASDDLQAAGSMVIPNVPYSRQFYGLDCEEAALQMALAHEGLLLQGNNLQSQNDILSVESVDWHVPGIGPKYTSGDPMQTFVGPPNGVESGGYEPGAYYGAVAKAATRFGGQVIAAGENIGPTQLYAYVEEGHPVQAWVSFNFQPYHAITLSNGRDSWPWAGPHEHSVLVVGVGVDRVLIDNPWDKQVAGSAYIGPDQWVPMSVFEAAYGTYFDMAVVLN